MRGKSPPFFSNMSSQNPTTVNFVSYNSTGLSTLKTHWIRDLAKITNATFSSIQEHFKKNKNTDKYFKDEFPNFSSYVIPGHRENTQDKGRPKGGLAQLSVKNIVIKKQRLSNVNFRVQGQILTLPKSKLLYCPNSET